MNGKDNDYDIKGYVREYLPLVDRGSWPLVFRNPNPKPPALSYPLLWCIQQCADNFCTSVKDSLHAIIHSLPQAMPNKTSWKVLSYTTRYDDDRLRSIPIALGYDGEIHWQAASWVPYLHEHYDGIELWFDVEAWKKLERLGTRDANMQQKMMDLVRVIYSNMYSILQSAIERENITADDNNMQYRYRIIGLRLTNDGNSIVIHLRYFWNKENTNSKAFREEYYPNGVLFNTFISLIVLSR